MPGGGREGGREGRRVGGFGGREKREGRRERRTYLGIGIAGKWSDARKDVYKQGNEGEKEGGREGRKGRTWR